MKLHVGSTSTLSESKSILPDPTSDIQNHKCIQIAPDEIPYIMKMKEYETGVFVIKSGEEVSDNLTIFHRNIEESSSPSALMVILILVLVMLVYVQIMIFYSLHALSIAYTDLNGKVTSANVSLATALF
jgi:hypothetical protein